MENIIFYFVVFIFGLIIGSFLNCLIYRLHISEGFTSGRSYCPHCKHKLSWQDLIPILGFLILKGKCRYCHKKISWQYPLVEIATGLLFVSCFMFHVSYFDEFSIFNFQNLLSTLYFLLITCLLIIIFVYDLKHYIIPDKVIYPAIVIALIFNFQFSIFNQAPIFNFQTSIFLISILSAILASGFFLTIVVFSKGKWMGFGDVKLAFLMGLILSWPNILVALFLAFFIGAIIGIGLIAIHKKTLKSEIPFGPFLVVGTFIALFWGESLIGWYLSLFL